MFQAFFLSLFLLSPLQPPIVRAPVVQMPFVEEVLQSKGPTLKLPAEVKTGKGFVVVRPLEYDGDDLAWNVLDAGLSLTPPELHPDPGVFVAVALTDGRYRIQAVAVKLVDGKARLSAFQTCVIIVGDPGPLPPVPPDPPIPPKPPDPPVPPLPPAPIPLPGLRVLGVFESSDSSKDAAKIFSAGVVRDYLRTKCVTGADGAPELRFYDKDTIMSGAPKHWQDAMKRPRQALPWLIISNGKTGYEGPAPTTVDAMMTLLKKYGD